MSLEITKHQTFEFTKIYFGSKLHLAFAHKRIVSLQTWRDYSGTQFVVELLFDCGASLVCEYDTESKWERVVAIMEECFGKNI